MGFDGSPYILLYTPFKSKVQKDMQSKYFQLVPTFQDNIMWEPPPSPAQNDNLDSQYQASDFWQKKGH